MASFKLPELIIPSKKAKDQRIHVQFSIFSQLRGRVVRKRIYLLEGKTSKEQIQYAHLVLMPEITKQLLEGNTIGQKTDPQTSKLSSISVLDGLKHALSLKSNRIGDRAKDSYSLHLNKFTNYVYESQLEGCLLANFTREKAVDYQNYLVKKVSNRTNKNNTDTLRTLFNVILNLDNPPITKNPFASIEKLSISKGKNLAYTKPQRKLILDIAKEKYPQMYLLINTMFFTLMRSNELEMLQRKHIGMYHPDKIYLEAQANTKRITERHIEIHESLDKLFREYGIYDLPREYYIFSADGLRPGSQRVIKGKLGESHNNWILKKIPEFKDSKDYTLYSWKHTGVSEAYLSGVLPHNIMVQTGHKDRQSFEVYLKSLGLLVNSDFKEKMPGILG